METATGGRQVKLYDTTLRDGSQRQGISFSVEDKLKITRLLDGARFHYIEGGWPGSNPKDCEFFKRVKDIPLQHARITAFGSTRRHSVGVEDDPNLNALIEAGTPVVALVGKSWDFHVKEVLRTTLEENLAMIRESVRWMKEHGKEVVYDAEHFFDGYAANPDYAVSTLKAACEGGADVLVLCDTNGGSLPGRIRQTVEAVRSAVDCSLGIHVHNDGGLAVANTLAAVEAGCEQVQGTVNGYGERCGNADLISIIPNLQLKMNFCCVPADGLAALTDLSMKVSGIANLNPDKHAPFVGAAAFAHKGGIHVAAVEKAASSYEHIDPAVIGNRRHFLISELSGRGNIRMRAAEMGLQLQGNENAVLEKIKELEHKGFQFENAEGTFELLLRKDAPDYRAPFERVDMMVVSESRGKHVLTVEAMVKLRIGETVVHTVSEGDGPVHALDQAVRKALLPFFPELERVQLADYKVRILDPDLATAATTRVTIEAACEGDRWSTVGVSYNIIDASYAALADSYELFLLRNAAVHKRASQPQVG